MKKLSNSKGVKTLSKMQQKSINGARRGELCNDGPPPYVVCYFPSRCVFGSNGWYCA